MSQKLHVTKQYQKKKRDQVNNMTHSEVNLELYTLQNAEVMQQF